MKPRPNVILVTADSLRPDHSSALGYRRRTTPFLEGLADQALLFEQAVANSVPTYYSFQVMMSSRFPCFNRLKLDPAAPSLPCLFQAAGYETAGFVAANPVVSRLFNYHRGFDRFEDYGCAPGPWKAAFGLAGTRTAGARPASPGQRISRSLRGGHPILKSVARAGASAYAAMRRIWRAYFSASYRFFPPAGQVIEESLRWLDGARKPCFLWLHLMDSHHPYLPSPRGLRDIGVRPSGRWRQLELNRRWHAEWAESERHLEAKLPLREEVMTLYDATIRDIDAGIEKLHRHLAGRGLLDNTILVIVSDHGEQFLERGRIFHRSDGLDEELIRIFLMIHAPGSIQGGRVKGQFPLIDLAPGLLSLAGLEAPPAFEGSPRSLTSGAAGEYMLVGGIYGLTDFLAITPAMRLKRVFALRGERCKIVHHEADGAWEFYDLMRDPWGHENLWHRPGGEDLKASLAAALRSEIERLDAREADRQREPGDDQPRIEDAEEKVLRERLGHLGYL